MIWVPFVFALVLGLIIAGALYVAYRWPAVEPSDEQQPPPVDRPKPT